MLLFLKSKDELLDIFDLFDNMFSNDSLFSSNLSSIHFRNKSNRVILNKTDIPDGISDKEKWGLREIQLNYRVGDVQFLLDEMENGQFLPPSLQNMLELDNIGIFGHSFGGATSVVASLKDDQE